VDTESADPQQAFWDERFDDARYIFGTAPNAFLVSQAQLLKPGMRALVPGDGEGRNSVWVARQGLAVEAVDISGKGIAKAARLASEAGVEVRFERANLLTWDWPKDRYDVVAALFLHFFDADRPLMHLAMLDALKPGGLLILESFNPRQLEMQKVHKSGGPRIADMLYSKEKLAADFADMDIALLEETETELDEGHRHSGHAAVIRCIARKRCG
jgi:2-polyprenyl-3-methyl-5-hydroxy-6-metoxy-1,4-benzoquinol methylase